MNPIKWTPIDSRDIGRWLRVKRTAQSPAEYACAVQHEAAKGWQWADMAILAIGIVAVALLVAGQI